MIKQLEHATLPQFLHCINQNPVTGSKMAVRYELFGNSKVFLKNYTLQNGENYAAMQIFEATAYLAAPKLSAKMLAEAAEFARFMGANLLELYTEHPMHELTGFCQENFLRHELNTVFECRMQSFTKKPQLLQFQTPQSLKNTYTLLCECFPQFKAQVLYEDFLAEFMPKINHQKAVVFNATVGCKTAATSALLFVSKNCALLGAVAVVNEFRGTGLGKLAAETALLSHMAVGKQCFAVAADKHAENFYKHLKFQPCGCQLTVAL